jgi:hypothetical protein
MGDGDFGRPDRMQTDSLRPVLFIVIHVSTPLLASFLR